MNENTTMSFDLDLSECSDPLLRQRRLISRILSASNHIANISRRGSANWVHVPLSCDMEKYLVEGSLAGIKVVSNTTYSNLVTVQLREDDEIIETVSFEVIL